ncbi:MAG: hypothetical protein ACLP1X_12760 [Polyangiaceae bacterium]
MKRKRVWTVAAAILAGGAVGVLVLLRINEDPVPAVTEKPPETRAASPARIEIPPDLERTCRSICDRSRKLACPKVAECMPNCTAMGSATPCTAEFLAMFGCLVKQPLNNWECAPDGVAAVKDGVCDAEQRAAIGCMELKMSR